MELDGHPIEAQAECFRAKLEWATDMDTGDSGA